MTELTYTEFIMILH